MTVSQCANTGDRKLGHSLYCGTEVLIGLLLDGCVVALFLFRGQELRRTV